MGYLPELDLRAIAECRRDGEGLSDDQRATWKRCHRLLPEEDDSVEVGDIVLLPHLPRERRWSIARVTGDYRFEPLPETGDHGHLREVELLHEDVDWHHRGADARLRSTMRNAYPMWNIDRLGEAVDSLLARLAFGRASPGSN